MQLEISAPPIIRTRPPDQVLSRNLFFIKNAVKTLEAKTSDKFDIYDPDRREVLLECREPDLSGPTKLQRLAGGKYDIGSPLNLVACIPGSRQQIFRVARRVPFLSFNEQPIEFYDRDDRLLATLRRKFFCIGRKFPFYTPQNTPLFELNAKSILNGYRLCVGDKEFGTLWLKWKGEHKTYFELGFKYALAITEEASNESGLKELLLGFALCFDRIKK